MAIEDLFQEGTDKVLDDRVARPLAEPVPQRSFGANLWGLTTAAPRGIGAGANESAGFFSDILGAYGEVQAGYGRQADPTLLFDAEAAAEAKAAGAGSRARIASGEAFSTELGTSFRATARSFAPDPQTAGKAEQLIFGLGRFATKAVGYSLAAGPIPGAVLTGADEGMTEADRLKAEGVDIQTRTKVGAVAGVVAGVSVALPIAGKTLAQTAGLVAVGGPGGFYAQQAASKAILENAGYDKLAEQHDPFDPVGLAVSTLVPAAFGGFAMRVGRARQATPPTSVPVAPKPLEAVMSKDKLVVNDRDGKDYQFTIKQGKAGENSSATLKHEDGSTSVLEWKETPGGHVIDVINVSPALRGSGIGSRLYKALIEDALSKGKVVESDAVVSSDAIRVYKKLQEEGYGVEFNKNVQKKPSEDGRERIISKGPEPVVRVVSMPKAKNQSTRELSRMGGNERLALKHDDPRLDAYAVTAAQREGIPPEVLLAIKNVGERSAPTAVSPKGAKGVMQFMDETWATYGKGDPRDPIASIDAAAAYIKDLTKHYGGDVRAAIAHYNGGGKAGQAVREGRLPPAREARDYLQRTDNFIAERSGTEAGRAAASDPDMVAAARVKQVRDVVESWNLRDPADAASAEQHLNAVLRASDQLGAGQRVDIGDAFPLDTLGQARLLDNFTARLEQARAELLPEAGNVVDPGVVAPLRAEIAQLEQSRPAATDEAMRALAKEIQADKGISYKAALSAAKKDIGVRLESVEAQIGRLRQQLEGHRAAAESQKQIAQLDGHIAQVKADRAAIDAPTPRPGPLAVKQALADLPAPKPAKSETVVEVPASKAPAAASETAPAAPNAKAGANPMAASLEAQSAEIANLSPDMMVQLEGMDAPMRLADALEAVKAEAAREVRDAPLLKVATECFLRSA